MSDQEVNGDQESNGDQGANGVGESSSDRVVLNAESTNGRRNGSKKRQWPTDIDDLAMPFVDTGVFHAAIGNPDKRAKLSNGTANGTDANVSDARANRLAAAAYQNARLNLTKAHNTIEQKFASYLDTANVEPSLLHHFNLDDKQMLFRFTDPATDSYPPHLDLEANKPAAEWETNETEKSTLGPQDAFDPFRGAQLLTLLPDKFKNPPILGPGILEMIRGATNIKFGSMGRPDQGATLADAEAYNKMMRDRRGTLLDNNDIFNQENIADLPDWYSDARFAQQQFTGTNPTTIERASPKWLQHFAEDAVCDPEDEPFKKDIRDLVARDAESLYIQDYSYFRSAAGFGEDQTICVEYDDPSSDDPAPGKAYRYGIASVCLFHLAEDGMLEPLAIVLDWRGNAQNSVTVYNKRLSASEQAEDWPWRYAKTCVMTSDWLAHEVGVHLVRTHFVEEATIVAAQRSFDDTHPILQLLYPHWQKTLSINAGARANLVPEIFTQVLGYSTEQVKSFIMYEYTTFDFQGKYVPVDLASRGFPIDQLHTLKYKNYAYARCIHSMWYKIRSYVSDILSIHYGAPDSPATDSAVLADSSIATWCTTMRRPGNQGGAQLKHFPVIDSFASLVDACTMCIHIASPQHTAVNYLQNYFQAFVPNRPPVLFTPPPRTLEEVKAITEETLVEALPMNRPREWLLASHIPYLLSDRPGEAESLIGFAASKFYWSHGREGEDERRVGEAARKLYEALAASEDEFRGYGEETWDAKDHLYHVLSPSWNAVAIVI